MNPYLDGRIVLSRSEQLVTFRVTGQYGRGNLHGPHGQALYRVSGNGKDWTVNPPTNATRSVIDASAVVPAGSKKSLLVVPSRP